MLTERRQPELSLNELHQLRWSLGGLLALVSVWSVWYLQIDASILLLVTTVAALSTLLRPAIAGFWPGWAHKLAFPVALAAVVFDLYTFGELLPAFVRLAIMLLLYRVSTYRKRRDDLQLILLGLFLIITTGVLTVSIGFAVQIILFAALALGLLMAGTLVDAAEAGQKPSGVESRCLPVWVHVNWPHFLRRLLAVSDWRVLGLGVFLFVGLVMLSALMFLAIPRFQVDSSLFLDRWMNKRSVSGFSDTLRFGEVSDIQKDESIALRVEVSDPREIPAELYWRMIVLDEYHDSAFRISQQALAGLSAEHTLVSIDWFALLPGPFGNGQWKFYLEPGVSRYLPLMGEFSHLAFNETQSFRTHRDLRLLVLSRDPSTMKAYQVERMNTTGVMRETSPLSSLSTTGRKLQAEVRAHLIGLPFTASERAQWKKAADEILNGKKMNAEEFARAATFWLHARHSYSLQSEVPTGEGDPLVRWAMSTEPGHCELYAGAFTMLARTAGFPTRVVAGFSGGTWNGDYMIVRNSNAHAWCEINDGAGSWMRVDPTVAPSQRNQTATQREEAARSRIQAETGWTARVDRLRMLWYRRIVNFERQDQMSLVKSLKRGTEASGKAVREWATEAVNQVRAWLTKPWDLARYSMIGAVLVAALCVGWFWRALGRDWWLRWRVVHHGAVDPVRREAGRWLTRFSELPRVASDDQAERKAMEADLQRLRYGRRESWTVPEQILRRARSVFKETRRRSRGQMER